MRGPSSAKAHEGLLAEHVEAAREAAGMRGAWLEGGVHTSTKSSPSSASSDSTESASAPLAARSAPGVRAGRRSVAATIPCRAAAASPAGGRERPRCRDRRSRPGVSEVSPMALERHSERFVQDGQSGPGGLLGDEEGRVDPDGRRVGHRHEAAPEALQVEIAGDALVERLAGLPVLDQLDAEQEPAAPHLAHRAVLLLQAPELREHDARRPGSDCSTRCSFRMISRAASPAADASGLPP